MARGPKNVVGVKSSRESEFLPQPKCISYYSVSSKRPAVLTSPSSEACSNTLTLCPLLARAIAHARPPSPAPTMITFNFTVAVFGGDVSDEMFLFKGWRKCNDRVGYSGASMVVEAAFTPLKGRMGSVISPIGSSKLGAIAVELRGECWQTKIRFCLIQMRQPRQQGGIHTTSSINVGIKWNFSSFMGL